MAIVTELWVYPVKSLGGIRVDEAEIHPAGFRWDRRWMVVDSQGRFLTRRTEAAMCRIGVALEGESFRLSADGFGDVTMPIEVDGPPELEVLVWGSQVQAVPGPAPASAWLEAVLGRSCRLVYQPAGSLRPVNPEFGRAGDVVSFADGYPVMLTTESSVADLAARVPDVIMTTTRFRPNIVVSGSTAYAEDGWTRVHIGAAQFDHVKPCERCVVVDTDPESGARSDGVLAELARYRRWRGGVRFGVNLVPRILGRVRVGDEVVALESSPGAT